MSDKEEDYSPDIQKSNRRRRWEVKSKESFETSLAVEVESPDKNEIEKTKKKSKSSGSNVGKRERPKSSRVNTAHKKKHTDSSETNSNGDNVDIVSEKLSILLKDAANKSKQENEDSQILRNSEESLIKNELKDYFEPIKNAGEPTAPPLSSASSEEMSETPKKKTRVKSADSGVIINSRVTQQLNQFKDDIVEGKEISKELTSIPSFTISGLMIQPSSSSTMKGNISTIYCERLNNFIITNKDQFLRPKKNEPLRDIRKKETKKIHALFLQTGFRTFSVLCQGLLAGIMVAHCLLIFLLEEATYIILKKNALEHTFFSLIFFLSCICLVSSLDRYDVAGQGIFSEHGLRIPWTPLFYLVSFILTLIAVRAEDFITHFDTYPADVHSKKNDLLMWWKYMCVARTLFAVMAWVTLVGDPHTDALNVRLKGLVDD